ncbi:hypothetical protein [Sporosarcina ureilytica]|uniref:DUF3592 domain-containing protein n=1 Tax=Sporosarcina ureilytica TaxID=298596 RepID=A0A1D8JDD2_9BACL|nr:hypothetical protein [Sporosarcina ureilytica]AOV06727.1 hypothetical protein BI350_03380 [Sporosarcina ureilytica]
MIGKVSKGILKTLAFGVGLWITIYAIMVTVTIFLSDYDLFDTVDSPAVVTEKFSKKGLVGTPTYYVLVDLNEQNPANDIENRVFSWQFNRLEVGDTIKGHYIRGEHFITTLDVIVDSMIGFVFLLAFLILLISLVCWPVYAFVENRKKQKKLPQVIKTFYRKKNARKKRKLIKSDGLFLKVFRKAFLPTVMVMMLLSISGFLLNSVQKFSPIGKTKVEALVTDSDSYGREYYGSGHMTDPYYSLELLVRDEIGKEYKVIKEVTRNVYKKHAIGDTIKISYMNGNPYNVFVLNYSLYSLEIVTYGKFALCIIILMCLLLYLVMKFKKKA